MTRPIGEVFTFFDHKLVVVEDGEMGYLDGCALCALRWESCGKYNDITGACGECERADEKNVHFEKKGGE
jgi:hypothetical protein